MRIGDTITSVFTTQSLSNGAAKNAAAPPSASVRRNGTVLAGVSVPVTNLGTGRYKAVVQLAPGDGWAVGDSYAVEVTYSMEGAADIPIVVAQGPVIEPAAVAGSAMTLTSGERNSVAAALLKYDWSGVTGEAARSLLNALRALRNRLFTSGPSLTVTKEDDSTPAWTASVSADSASKPVTDFNPD